MLGTFQQSSLRIEVPASAQTIHDSLLYPASAKQWLWPQRFSQGLPEKLYPGLVFTSYLGPIAIQHEVATVTVSSLQFLLSGGIDGFHEWLWGDGWVQSRLEGVSLLPLNLGQTLSLVRLKQFLQSDPAPISRP